LKKNGFSIYSVECHERSKNFKEVSCKNDEKICLVLGNEKTGVNEKILDISDHILEIPML
jgi:tRNA G18 (ribose-2'-O)-methylase SpoU